MADGNGSVSNGSSNGAVAASLINGATQLGAAAMQNMGNKKQNREHRKWLEKMYDLQYQRNVELWNLQNVYNTPAAQVRRLREAGLNPNLMYGNGSGSTGLAGDIGTPTLPSGSEPMKYDFSQAANGIASSLAMYQNWQMNNLNMQNVDSQTKNYQAQTAYNNALTAGRLINNDIDRVTRDMAAKNARIDYLAKVAGLSRTESETWLNRNKSAATQLAMFQDAASFDIRKNLWIAQAENQRASAYNAYANAEDARARAISGMYTAQAAQHQSVANLNNQQYDFLVPYYANGFNPNWTPGQALVSAGYRLSGDGPTGKKIKSRIPSLLDRGMNFVDKIGARILRDTTW